MSLSPEWPGLNGQILFDIFCVRKAWKFSFEQRAPYQSEHFVKDLYNAERHPCLGKIGAPDFVQEFAFKKKMDEISFYPKWLIDDDLFSTMKWVFAVTVFVDGLRKSRTEEQHKMHVRLCVLPERIVSVYDPEKAFEGFRQNETIETLQNWASSFYGQRLENEDAGDVSEKVNFIGAVYGECKSTDDIFILVDRRSCSEGTGEKLMIFTFKNLSHLLKSHFTSFRRILGFEFEIGSVVKTWLCFSMRQRIRFYPEMLVSLIPHLFVVPKTTTAGAYLKKIYSAEYKHQWAVPLDDANFNLYYKAITGDDHVSNNYHREKAQKDDGLTRTFGFWEYLRRRISYWNFQSVHPKLLNDDMDSDAVFDDLLEIEDDGQVYVDEDDSNILADLKPDTTAQLKSTVFRWKAIECGPAPEDALHLRDCHHFTTVMRYLVMFENYGHDVNAANLFEFHLSEIIESIDHIVSVHKLLVPEHRAEIQRYVAVHLNCDDASKCMVLRKNANRRREREDRGDEKERDQYKEQLLDQIERECVVMNETLYSIHSLLMHRGFSLQNSIRSSRFQNNVHQQDDEKNDQKEMNSNDRDATDAPNAIDFGVSVLRWIPFAERPHFECFRDEITRNKHSTITEEIFQQFLIECSEKIRNSTFTLKEMMALKLFTDTNALQSFLRKAHWVNSSPSMRKTFYFWASALYEAALYHSVPIPSADGKTPMTLYHGVNQMFTVDTEAPKYHGPFSSTTVRSVAHGFTNEEGLFFKMQPSYANKLRQCIGVKVESISCHKHEREILLVDQFLPITNTKTFRNSDNALVNYLIFSVKRWSLKITDKDRFFKQLGIQFDPDWMPLIGQNSQLFATSTLEGKTVIGRLAAELDLYGSDWISFPLQDEAINLQVLEELLLAGKDIDRLLPPYLVLTSKFHVVQSHNLKRCYKIEFTPNTKMKHLDARVNDACFKSSVYQINGDRVPHTISKVKHFIRRIQCQNKALFGDRIVWTQEFPPGPQDDYSTDMEILNLVEMHGVKELLPHYRVLTSKFRVVRIAPTKQKTEEQETKEKESKIKGPGKKGLNYILERLGGHKNQKSTSDGHSKKKGGAQLYFFKIEFDSDTEMDDNQSLSLVERNRTILWKQRNSTRNRSGKSVNDSCFEETEYKINGQRVPHTITSLTSPVNRITIECRNGKLFGDRIVWTQEYDDLEIEIDGNSRTTEVNLADLSDNLFAVAPWAKSADLPGGTVDSDVNAKRNGMGNGNF